ncbi:MAG: hypothetical protein SFY92_11255, partial [Verrucomicrobiae bacterium]|nr:hypothetical protein [Verrucomicrobiae bacterium]
DSDQPGCIHANMDLYKWAYKLLPWIPSELVADCFENAMAARTIDMRASPYDLRDQGYEPICIETEEGRDEYVRHQREITARAQPLRQRLAEFHEKILEEAVESPQKAGFAQGIWELQMDTDQTRMRSVAGRDAQGPPLDSSPDI